MTENCPSFEDLPMANGLYRQFYYTRHKFPIQIDCNFVVDSTNGNGFGIRSLKGFVSNVFMQTSATPAAGNPFINSVSKGLILVQLVEQYNKYLGGYAGFVSPTTGSALSISSSSVLTIGQVYIIVSVGTSTPANWQAMGLPTGVIPGDGVSFIASATGSGTGTGQVEAVGVSGNTHIEVVGDANQTIQSTNPVVLGGTTVGPYILMQCLGPTSVSNPTPIPVAPANGTVIGLTFVLSNYSSSAAD